MKNEKTVMERANVKKTSKFNFVSGIKLASFLSLTVLGYLFYKFDLHLYLELEYIKAQREEFKLLFQQNPFRTAAIFCSIYLLVTTFSFPGATVLTLLAGALFPFPAALAMVSFSSVMGATFALIITRFLYQNIIRQRFNNAYEIINRGFKKEGKMYLFALRLVPIFPFFLVNYIFAITTIPAITFLWVSALGMLPGTIVYINAGYQLSVINSISEIASFNLIGSFVAIALVPYLSRLLINNYRNKKLYDEYEKPKTFQYNLVVIGGGSAGLVSSYIAASAGAKVLLIEKSKMGGDCLNHGCVPSKSLLKIASEIKNVNALNKSGYAKSGKVKVNFPAVMQEVKKKIKLIEPHDSKSRYEKLGVECLKGTAKIISPFQISVGKRLISTKSIIVATGANPMLPGMAKDAAPQLAKHFLTSDSLWGLKELPDKLLIVGGGPIGIEMAQAFSALGSKVTIVEAAKRLLSRENEKASELIEKTLTSSGVEVFCNYFLEGFTTQKNKQKSPSAIITRGTNKKNIPFSKVLFATGRVANTKNIGLEKLGIETRKNGTIIVNEYLQTSFPNILACGDVCGPYQLTHAAAHQAWYACMNALFGKWKLFKVNYRAMGWCTYGNPEVATVGLTIEEATRKEINFEITEFALSELDRAIIEDDDGFVQVLTSKGKDKILGATIASKNASAMIIEFTSAIKNKRGLKSILSTVHIYPTLSEANKYVAGKWQKNNLPTKLIAYSKKYLAWRRG